jgi:IMP dehydrogenase
MNILKYTEQLHNKGCTVFVGNVASLDVAIPFISAGVDAIILGIGPGSICTTRKVLGIGAGHISSISEVREYIERHRSLTRLIADGGIANSGDIVKLLCTGAHAVILGGMFAHTTSAPFCGFHWGMSAPHKLLPRGNLQKFEVDDDDTIDRVLNGPSYRDDGTMAILPALTNALSNLGCLNIADAYFKTSVVQFPGIKSEGKNGNRSASSSR